MSSFNFCTSYMPCSTYLDEEHSILLKSSCILPCTCIFPRGIPRAVYIYIRLRNELDKAYGLNSSLRNKEKSRASLADVDICLSPKLQEIIDLLATDNIHIMYGPEGNS